MKPRSIFTAFSCLAITASACGGNTMPHDGSIDAPRDAITPPSDALDVRSDSIDVPAGDVTIAPDVTAAPDVQPDTGPPLMCTAPQADCNGDRADGCETDLGTSAANCGRCGRSCGAATCTAGECAGVELAMHSGNLTPIDVDDTNVYFGADVIGGSSSISATPKAAPGAATELLSPPLGGPTDIQVFNGALYASINATFGSQSRLLRIPLPSGAAQNLITSGMPSGGFTPSGIAVNATTVYLSDTSQSCMSTGTPGMCCSSGHPCNPGRIFRVPNGGGAFEIFADNENQPTSVAVDAANVYWTADGSRNAAGTATFTATPMIRSAPIAGGGPTTLATLSAGNLVDIAAPGDGFVYYGLKATAPSGGIYRVATTGGTPEPVVTGEILPLHIAVRGSALAWTALNGTVTGSVFVVRYRGAPGEPVRTVFTPASGSASTIVMDDQAIYAAVSSSASGPFRIMRFVR